MSLLNGALLIIFGGFYKYLALRARNPQAFSKTDTHSYSREA